MKKYLDEKAMTRFRKRAMTRALPQDHIYHEITHHLLERLDLIRMKPSVIVNAGWHTAVMHQKLQQQYPQAKIIDVHAVDELLSLQAESVDLVIACFVLLCER
ncbi:MAG TPA: hypothetical protein VI844_03085, partial [Coxiellaceae bacterium]|nr:hypothetical protein [Coxiellaceae bacterium]